MILDTDRVTFEVVRGDTLYIPLELNSGTREFPEHYELQGNDRLYVGIMTPGQSFEHALIRIALDASSPKDNYGNTLLFLSHNNTSQLEPGKYYISIKFVSDSNVTTLVDQKLFFVTGTSIRGNSYV